MIGDDEDIPFDDDKPKRFGLSDDEIQARIKAARENARRAEYGEYLRSATWASKRDAIMQRAGGKCERCQNARASEVHHLTYIRRGHEDLADLIALCEPCHTEAHGGRAKLNKDAMRRVWFTKPGRKW